MLFGIFKPDFNTQRRQFQQIMFDSWCIVRLQCTAT